MIICGIDPGLSGAISFIEDGRLLTAFDMPVMPFGSDGKKQQVNAARLAYELRSAKPDCVVIEKVGAMPGQGVTAMFNFGMSFGTVIGVVGALDIPIHYATPQKWKKHFRLSGAEKDLARTRCIELYPSQSILFARKKDCGRADATLIALYFSQQQ